MPAGTDFGSPIAINFTLAKVRSVNDFRPRVLFFGTIRTMVLVRRFTREPARSRFSFWSLSIWAAAADRNTSQGAPCSIWVCSVPELP